MSEILPPPPQPRGNDGCFKFGAITCGVGCLLLVVAGVLFVIYVVPKISKTVGGVMKSAMQIEPCQAEMVRIYKAIEKYHKDKGKYPDTLKDLVPTYLDSERRIKFSENPSGPDFSYTKPTETTQPGDDILHYAMPPSDIMGQKIAYVLHIHKDGQFDFEQRQTMPMKGRFKTNVN